MRGRSPTVRRRGRGTAVLVLVAAGATALTACSGDSGGSSAGTPSGGGRSGTGSSSAPAAGGRQGAPGPAITLAFAGDVHFEGASRAALSGGLSAITPVLSRADLTVVNLETAVTTRGTAAAGKQFTFRAPPAAFPALRSAGVDLVTMANNHALDYGQVGLSDSLAAARDAGVPVVGAGADEDAAFAPHVADVKGRRVAVIGATRVLDADLADAWTAGPGRPGLASAKDTARLVRAVEDARRVADVVVVDLHWGTEQVSCPTDDQRGLAAALSDAGADAVVGSHAHVLLGGGWRGRTYVDYGLGNFVFYARTGPTQATGVLTLTLQGRAVTSAAWAPARIQGGVPVPLSGAAGTASGAAKDRLRGCTGLSASPAPS